MRITVSDNDFRLVLQLRDVVRQRIAHLMSRGGLESISVFRAVGDSPRRIKLPQNSRPFETGMVRNTKLTWVAN